MITGIVRGPAGGVRGGVLFRRAPVPDGFEAPLAPPPLRGERGMVRLTGGAREAPAAIATTRPRRGSVGVAEKAAGRSDASRPARHRAGCRRRTVHNKEFGGSASGIPPSRQTARLTAFGRLASPAPGRLAARECGGTPRAFRGLAGKPRPMPPERQKRLAAPCRGCRVGGLQIREGARLRIPGAGASGPAELRRVHDPDIRPARPCG